MNKKLLIIKLGFSVLIILCILLIALVGCTKKTTTITTTTTPTVYKLRINDHNPPPTGPAIAVDRWAAYVEEQSGGRIDIEAIHGAALFTGNEIYGQLAQNGCDGGVYVVLEEDGFLLNMIPTMPFLGFPEQHFEDMFYTLWDEFPEFAAEWDDVTVLSVMIMPGTQFHTVSKVINTPADMAGVKMFCAETPLVNIVNAVGGVGVQQPITDMAPSVQTGLVEGVFNHYPVCNVFGALELLHSHTEFGGGINFTPMFLLMSNATIDKLPDDLKNLVLNSGDVWFNAFKEMDDADMARAIKQVQDAGDTIVKLTPAQIAEWRDIIKADVIDAAIAKCEDQGLPGQEIYDRLLELIEASR